MTPLVFLWRGGEMAKINVGAINDLINKGYIRSQKHPVKDLYIFNYTEKAQYDNYWDENTLLCRALVADKDGNIVARSFKKFFNYDQHIRIYDGLPSGDFEVYDKKDGSLILGFHHDGELEFASKGSFTSEHAQKAKEIFYKKYPNVQLDKDKTYSFELVSRQFRIVVDYGDVEDLFLLGIFDVDGNEYPIQDIGMPIVERFDWLKDINEILKIQDKNREGFVIRYADGSRVKAKMEEYLRLHRLLSNYHDRDIWEHLRLVGSVDDILENVPDEFYQWIKNLENKFLAEFREIEDQCKRDFVILEDRRETALHYQRCKYPSVLFNMLDKRDYKDTIWKLIKPKIASKPYIFNQPV